MQSAIHIGTVVSKESLAPLADAIMRIIEARADQETIRAGLKALSDMAHVNGVSISNCVITNGKIDDVGFDTDKQADPEEDLDDDRASHQPEPSGISE